MGPRLLREGDQMEIEDDCVGCGEGVRVPLLEPHGTCPPCGADVDPDESPELVVGRA